MSDSEYYNCNAIDCFAITTDKSSFIHGFCDKHQHLVRKKKGVNMKCPNCGKKYSLGDVIESSGSQLKCSECDHWSHENKWVEKPESSNINPKHYTDMAISPHEYNKANKIEWNEAQIIKYVSRWRAKGGLEDLLKAKWYLDDLIKGVQDSNK